MKRADAKSGHAPVEGSKARADAPDRILAAARRVLARDGLEGLTVAAVTQEAGVYISAVSYHFGGIEGLRFALVAQLLLEEDERAHDLARHGSSGGHLLREVMERFAMMGGREVELAFYETIVPGLRTPELNRRLVHLYAEGRKVFVDTLSEPGEAAEAAALAPYGLILLAFVDGLTLQLLVEPDLDIEPALTFMEEMVLAHLSRSR